MTADLSAAADAAYRAHHVARRGRAMVPGEYEATYSRVEAEWMAASVDAAERVIREQVARDIEASRIFEGVRAKRVIDMCARIARGGSR